MSSDRQSFSTRRLEALTDGVFAIAMTLLVLDLNVAELGNAASNQELWHALTGMSSNLVSFVVSFLLLGSMWAVHVRQFEHIQEADRRLTAINTLRLLIVVLIPFTTSLAGTYSGLLLGEVLFPINFLTLAIVSWWQWQYAAKHLRNDMSAQARHKAVLRNSAVVIIATLVVVFAIFVGEYAFLLFAATPLAIGLLEKMTRPQ
ncbi:DUF1211 domain-containing protein [Candidatus Saccharibacteria bacterium]|nr:DUF1211 domain-containing protein [Candidatus Saccharibacteria bacterium]